jgi:tRNA1(Val) A37 N6-methylase TrmN6
MTEKQEIFTLLDGRVKMLRSEYNTTSDAVWLAALPEVAPKKVLDVGIGTGGVALCLHHHFPDAKIMGIDIASDMLDICAKNAALNQCDIELDNQDILSWSTPRTFDLVVSNPPYFLGTPSKKHPQAHHNVDLSRWIKRCAARVCPQGYFCTIVDASRLGEVMGVICKSFGSITIVPLFGAKQTAERVLIRARLGNHGNSVIHTSYPMRYDPILREGLTIQNVLSKIDPQC